MAADVRITWRPTRTWQVASLVGVLAIIEMVALWVLSPHSFVYPDAYHYAELGRQLYRGEGFTSLQTYPYILSWYESHGIPLTPPWPNVARFPLITVLYAAVFHLTGPTVDGVLLTGAVGFVLLAVCVTVLGARLFSPMVGLITGLAICFHGWLVSFVFSGLLETWAATLVVAVAWALLSAHRSLRHAVLLGLLLALAFLLRYDLLVLVPAAFFSLAFAHRQELWRSTLGIVLGFSTLVLPWVGRNLAVTGDPVAMLSIDRNLFRASEMGADPYAKGIASSFFDQLAENLEMIFGKLSSWSYAFHRPELLAGEGNLWIALVAVASILWLGGHRRQQIWIFLAGSYALRVLLLSMMHHERRFYSSFVPMVLLLGIGGLWVLLVEKALPLLERLRGRPPSGAAKRCATLAVLCLAGVYFWGGLGNYPSLGRAALGIDFSEGILRHEAWRRELAEALPDSGIVATWQNELVSWEGDRPAVKVRANRDLRELLDNDLEIEALYYPEKSTPWLLLLGIGEQFQPGPILSNQHRVWKRRPKKESNAAPSVVLPNGPRLAVVYVPCTVNASRLAPYTEEAFYTPHLKSFAAQAKVFERHQAEAGQSGIAYAAILSGTQADKHQIFAHPRKIRGEVELLTESFAAAGWDVHAFTTQGMAGTRLGYWQGVPPLNRHRRPVPTGTDKRVSKILDRVVADPDYRALVVVSYTASHWPYQNLLDDLREHHPTETAQALEGLSPKDIEWAYRTYFAPGLRMDFPNARRRLDLDDVAVAKLARVLDWIYASNLRHVDELFGGMVAAIDERGLAAESVVVFTADHGEVLYRDNATFLWSHGFQLAPEVLRVPLLIRAPGVAPGRVASVTRSFDLLPTLGGLLGVAVSQDVSGIDLSDALRGQTPFPPDLLAFSHTSMVRDDKVAKAQKNWELFATLHPSSSVEDIWVSVRDHDMVFQWRHAGEGAFVVEAFDLSMDPEQRVNIFDPDRPVHARRLEQLQAYKQKLVAVFHGTQVPAAPITDRQIDKLRALGYVQ